MTDIELLRRRYVALNGARPTSANALSNVEALAGLPLPQDFRNIIAFFDDDGIYVRSAPTDNYTDRDSNRM